MNIFRIFFVSTVLVPILVVVVTSDESGIRLRKPRSIVISEDGTRTARRHNPVNITDKNCPSLGCTGNLTTNEYNGKGSLATSTLLPKLGGTDTSTERRFDSSSPPSEFLHDKPLKLKIKKIKNSTRTDLVGEDNDFIVADDDGIDLGTARGIISYSIVVSYSLFFTWRFIFVFIVYFTIRSVWRYLKSTFGIGDDYIEYYVKLGKDAKHPFHNYGGKWNPTLGVSLKSKIEELGKKGWTKYQPAGWKGWPSGGSSGWDAHGHASPYASSYPQHEYNPHQQPGWEPAYYAGWPEPEPDHGWEAQPSKKEKYAQKGWDSEEQLDLEEEGSLRHKFDRTKGLKIAKKYAKKYGKKAHKYGLRPSNLHSQFAGLKVLKGETNDLTKAHKFGVRPSKYFDKTGNINVGKNTDFGYVYRRRRNVLN